MERIKERLSSFELLRIIAMLFIVSSHYVYHGVLKNGANPLPETWISAPTWKKIFSCFLIQGELGVAVLFMISGFFLIRKERMKSIKRIVIQTVLWSWFATSLTVLFKIFHRKNLEYKISDFLLPFFCPVSSEYWFVTSYLIIVFCTPALNRVLISLSRKQYIILIAVLFLSEYLICAFIGGKMEGLARGFFFYICGGFISLYLTDKLKKFSSTQKIICQSCLILSFLIFLLFEAIGYYILYGIGDKSSHFLTIIGFCEVKTSVFLAAACLFVFFSSISLGSIGLINTISSSMFGVYLLHENVFASPVIWGEVFDISNGQLLSKIYAWEAMISILMVFVICSVIDFLLQKFLLLPVCKRTEKFACDIVLSV